MNDKLALMVEFEVKAERRGEFLALMREHAKLTLDAEPGCERFDVLDPGEASDRVFLFELYRDEKALNEHMNGALLASTRDSYADLINNKRVVRCTVS